MHKTRLAIIVRQTSCEYVEESVWTEKRDCHMITIFRRCWRALLVTIAYLELDSHMTKTPRGLSWPVPIASNRHSLAR